QPPARAAADQNVSSMQRTMIQIDAEYQQVMSGLSSGDVIALIRMEKCEKDAEYKARLQRNNALPGAADTARLRMYLPRFIAYNALRCEWARANSQETDGDSTATFQRLLAISVASLRASNSAVLQSASSLLDDLQRRFFLIHLNLVQLPN
ncbi:MAG: hypothetical protein ACRC7P_02950, partial [Enterovibrio sp.]